MSVLGTPTHLDKCTFCDSTSIIDSVACLLVVKVVRVSPPTFTRVPNAVPAYTLFKSVFKTWVKTFTSTLLSPYSMFLVLNLGRRNIFFFRPMKNLICYIASWGIRTSLGTVNVAKRRLLWAPYPNSELYFRAPINNKYTSESLGMCTHTGNNWSSKENRSQISRYQALCMYVLYISDNFLR